METGVRKMTLAMQNSQQQQQQQQQVVMGAKIKAEAATKTEAEAAAEAEAEAASAVEAETAAKGVTATELPSALHPSHGRVQMATEQGTQSPTPTVGRALGGGAHKEAASHRQQQVEAGGRQSQQ